MVALFWQRQGLWVAALPRPDSAPSVPNWKHQMTSGSYCPTGSWGGGGFSRLQPFDEGCRNEVLSGKLGAQARKKKKPNQPFLTLSLTGQESKVVEDDKKCLSEAPL